jgi:myo-inositol-1(or 4)-monophosphatase
MEELTDFKIFAKHLANLSGEVIKSFFRTGVASEFKKDLSPVTVADKNAEEIMRTAIMKEYPGHSILGEEFGAYNEGAEYQWVLDPIDGTKSFICGTVTFGTMIALLKNGQPILGVVNQPILNEFLMGDGNITELNNRPVRVRGCNNLSDAVLLTTDHLHIEKYQDINKFNELTHKVRLYRNWGDCYGYYLVATGYADIMIDPVMNPWDLLALVPIIRGAGGIITDYHGGDPVTGKSIIAAVPGIHQQVIDVLNK